jgi:glycosyltransferase involved in cell wall biosynthesis
MKKILLITNSSSVFFYFRKELVFDLLKSDFEVIGLIGDCIHKSQIETWGIKVHVVSLNNRSKNILSFRTYQKGIENVIEEEKPNFILTFQTKPNIFGIRAAKRISNAKVFSMVEGLGDGFSGEGLKGKLVALGLLTLYQRTLHYANKVFFLNKEDLSFLVNKRVVRKSQAAMIEGTGIDCGIYKEEPFNNFRTATMVSRLIPRKGVYVFAEAARICHRARPDLIFKLIGAESEIKKEDLNPYIQDGSIQYLGSVKDLKPELRNMSISIVPTFYLEGLPRAIMEAMATGRPVISTDARGCNASVLNGYNGLIVNQQDPQDLAKKMLFLFSNIELIKNMGKNARKFAFTHFSSDVIDKQVIDILEEN